MTDSTEQALRDYREQAERTSDEPLSGKATRPGWQRAKVLSVRLTAEEFDELNRYGRTAVVRRRMRPTIPGTCDASPSNTLLGTSGQRRLAGTARTARCAANHMPAHSAR